MAGGPPEHTKARGRMAFTLPQRKLGMDGGNKRVICLVFFSLSPGPFWPPPGLNPVLQPSQNSLIFSKAWRPHSVPGCSLSEAQLNCFARCHPTRLGQPTETLLPFALQFGNLYSLCKRDYKLCDGGAVSVLSLYIGSLSQILAISSCSTRAGFFNA